MDNNPAPDSLPAADTQSSGDPNQSPPPGAPARSGGMRVLQPTSDTLSPESPQQQPSPQPAPDPVPPAPASPEPSAPPPQPPAHSIYPEATHGINADAHQPTPSAPIDTKNESESLGFSDGYSLGGTIFLYQLIAVIVFSLVFYGIASVLLKTAGTSASTLVGILHYVGEYLILIYIPYSVLKSNAIEEPFWRSLFGAATQSVVDSIALFTGAITLLAFFVQASAVHVIGSASSNTGTSGFGVETLVVLGIFLIIAYFFTKLSWGVAFFLFGKIKNKIAIKAIGLTIIAVMIGGIAYHYITLSNTRGIIDKSTALTSSLSRYNVNNKVPFSVNFYKGSSIILVQGIQVLTYSGKNGGQVTILVGPETNPTHSCPSSVSSTKTFNFYSQGAQGVGCYELNRNGSDGYITIHGQNYHIDIFSSRQDQTLQTNKAILNSIVIN